MPIMHSRNDGAAERISANHQSYNAYHYLIIVEIIVETKQLR